MNMLYTHIYHYKWLFLDEGSEIQAFFYGFSFDRFHLLMLSRVHNSSLSLCAFFLAQLSEC